MSLSRPMTAWSWGTSVSPDGWRSSRTTRPPRGSFQSSGWPQSPSTSGGLHRPPTSGCLVSFSGQMLHFVQVLPLSVSSPNSLCVFLIVFLLSKCVSTQLTSQNIIDKKSTNIFRCNLISSLYVLFYTMTIFDIERPANCCECRFSCSPLLVLYFMLPNF